MNGEAIFEARDIVKTFPGVKALGGVGLSLMPGSIHALLGENGAGKSTLIKVVTGVHRPTSGELRLDGRSVDFGNPRDAIAAGIGVVHQERNLIPRFSVAENIHFESFGANRFKPIDYRRLNESAAEWLRMLDLDIDPAMSVTELSTARMQLVEIAKALSQKSRVLLLDEPTASLTSGETDTLFEILRRLRDNGTSLVFVSHKLEEVEALCDRVTVLRDGQNACESQSAEGLTRKDYVRLMIGRAESGSGWRKRDTRAAPQVLGLDDVASGLGHSGVGLSVRAGEIVGLYGLVGAGRTELARVILGQEPVTQGTVRIDGEAVRVADVSEAIHRYRLGYVSEDRKGEGLILQHSVLANAGVPIWRKLAGRFGFLSDATVRAAVLPYLTRLEVKTPSLDQTTANLSGGNQQKISVAKWLAAGVRLLIVDEPTVGIDIKTKAYLHDLLRELADGGTAILLISSDMPEIVALADRIVVMDAFRTKGSIENDGDYTTMSEKIMTRIQDRTPSGTSSGIGETARCA
ncbi:sugar ABC transporter ATP-binding protein [Fulvimarina endophytica]|uniref:Sugar ABC transporter ATP-binding protein n=1 Tax=Fulvimarina endophytica TaxID=2293836 RepID=A0A371WYC8_9HYPH|nr:sugar ABC transporter ATP-binding protein [Fulvimarina endophytica]RFC61993.1 sugar ABC transporter ATP-binding protein [Fulvimarina endophytica]